LIEATSVIALLNLVIYLCTARSSVVEGSPKILGCSTLPGWAVCCWSRMAF